MPHRATLRLLAFLLLAVMLSGAPRASFAGDTTSDIIATGAHRPITWELIRMLEHDAPLKALMETAVSQAALLNPDRTTNPVFDLESFYAFIDWSAVAMPWEISLQTDYPGLYDRIDQSMGCFYFVLDQPLEALEGKGYYHHSLMYHEPVRTWLIHFLSEYGTYLSGTDSWCADYYQNALREMDFHLDDGTYESPDNWHSFNDFFSRRLSSPAMRPIASPEDPAVVTSPADSAPQGVWRIDENSRLVPNGPEESEGATLKTGTLWDIPSLLGSSAYARAFAGGVVTHTFLDVNDYHRYHFPVSGTVREVFVIPADDAPGGVITWDAEANRYKEYDSENCTWQSIETRGVVIVETEMYGPVAIVPVGMCEVASVNFDASVVPGAQVQKGDEMGYFLFGGSDIVMVFTADSGFRLTAEAGVHLLMGESYGLLGPAAAADGD